MSVEKNVRGLVRFVCNLDPTAKQVCLVGTFNGWDPESRRMAKGRDGVFRALVNLVPGRYEYKFVIDGFWCYDPTAENQTINEYGTLNSVVKVEERHVAALEDVATFLPGAERASPQARAEVLAVRSRSHTDARGELSRVASALV
ncbi:MAG: hypothetical protein A3K19_07330 [Lentisphaerae bacterium RIFOXYB12_FULL_65_16]|nr:MAG: hypothetical protein A3K18_21535 [Lentisphaerae bacterium RIFOXYA12_64_32]OGV93354.1 MAG: hypothetical protein A3K19_07330 [Lentisphaerae bacterium RIFOXYB12_FULL_65_16]